MRDPEELEELYEEFMSDLPQYVPDGIVDVDLDLLHELDLLTTEDEDEDELMTQSFYVIESSEKLSLFNQKFLVWIVPQAEGEHPTTYTLIARNEPKPSHLEMVFTTSGVYNHSSLVLRILEKFLEQIEENEQALVKFKE